MAGGKRSLSPVVFQKPRLSIGCVMSPERQRTYPRERKSTTLPNHPKVRLQPTQA